MAYIRILVVFLIVLPHVAFAASPMELDRLYDALRGDDLMEILSEEGQVQAQDLQADMFPGRSSGAWSATTSGIYNAAAMRDAFRARFDAELSESDIAPVLAYLESDEGARVVQLEIDARRALMDEDVEQGAREAFAVLQDNDPVRATQLDAFVAANNLIDLNVSGALNSNLSFYNGLAAGGGFDLPQDQILADVWESAEGIRKDTTEWIYGYLTIAYSPLDDATLDRYIAFSQAPAGRALNRALFAAFDDLFRSISYDMGKAASRFTQGEDI